MKTARYSCKCRLCKTGWTSELNDRTLIGERHSSKCEEWMKRLSVRMERFKIATPSAMLNEHYQMSCLYMSVVEIKGRYNPDIKCNARCTGATGHNCECSCGGANHGSSKLA